jgi:hypothetical protein
MSNDLGFDISDLNQELVRLTADPKNQGNFLKNFVMMPKQSGVVQVRLLSAVKPVDGSKQLFYSQTRTHKLGDRNVHCPKVFEGGKWVGKCPVCEYYSYLYQQADKGAGDAEALRGEAKSIKPIERYYYNVIVRDNAETQQGEKDGPLILSVGKLLHTKIILGICGNKEFGEEGLGNVMDPKTGCDFKIIKKMKPGGDFPEYGDSKFLPKSLLSKDDAKVEAWLAARHDIYALRKVIGEDELKRALRIYKGVEKDPRAGGFDPSEYSSNSGRSNQSQPHTAPAQSVVAKPVVAVDEDLSLVDDDFIKDLRSSTGD